MGQENTVEKPNLKEDCGNVVILFFLYILQGDLSFSMKNRVQ